MIKLKVILTITNSTTATKTLFGYFTTSMIASLVINSVVFSLTHTTSIAVKPTRFELARPPRAGAALPAS